VIGSDPGEIASVKNVDCLIKVSLSSCSYSLRVTFCFPACHLLRLREHHGFNQAAHGSGLGGGWRWRAFGRLLPHILCDTDLVRLSLNLPVLGFSLLQFQDCFVARLPGTFLLY